MPNTSIDPKTPAAPPKERATHSNAAPAATPAAHEAAPSADDKALRAQARHKEEMAGTRILPTPDNAPTVAGMPRQGRSLAEPGDPGTIAPAEDVFANDPADLSQKR